MSHVPCIQDTRIERLHAGVRIPCFERQRRFYLVCNADEIERHETLDRMLLAHSMNQVLSTVALPAKMVSLPAKREGGKTTTTDSNSCGVAISAA